MCHNRSREARQHCPSYRPPPAHQNQHNRQHQPHGSAISAPRILHSTPYTLHGTRHTRHPHPAPSTSETSTLKERTRHSSTACWRTHASVCACRHAASRPLTEPIDHFPHVLVRGECVHGFVHGLAGMCWSSVRVEGGAPDFWRRAPAG